MQDLKYPIGKFIMPADLPKRRAEYINSISRLPHALEDLIDPLDQQELEYPYRPAGWTIQQVVHHLADSHMNAFCRFKLTLTEENPTIKPYLEGSWAEMADYAATLRNSLQILQGVHTRWVTLLSHLSEHDYLRTYFHPEYQKLFDLNFALAQYAWHGEHHLAHIRQALKFRNRFQ